MHLFNVYYIINILLIVQHCFIIAAEISNWRSSQAERNDDSRLRGWDSDKWRKDRRKEDFERDISDRERLDKGPEKAGFRDRGMVSKMLCNNKQFCYCCNIN